MANTPTRRVAARAARRATFGIMFGLPLGAACSLALNLDDNVPCSTDADCMYTTGLGTCQEGFCVPPGNGNDASTGETTEPGTTTIDPADSTTTDGPDETTTTGDPMTDSSESTTTEDIPACTVNSDCDELERCHADIGECVSLISQQCTTVVWPLSGERDNVEFLGSIMPTQPPFDELVEPLQNAHQLAIRHFNQGGMGLQGNQRIAWVGCDSTSGADAAVAAAEHLRDNVRAPAIVGPVFSEAVRQVAEQVTVPADMFIISPTASAPSLSDFPDDNLVWRITPNDIYQGNSLIDRFTLDLTAPPARMLVLFKDDAYGNELQQLIAGSLVADLAPAQVYFDSYQGPENFATQEDLLIAYGEVLSQALAQPGIAQTAGTYDSPDDHYTHILIIGTSEVEAFILSYAGAWGQFYNFAPFPLITVSHGGVPVLESTVANAVANPQLAPLAPLIQANLRGTSPNIFDPDNFSSFNVLYNIAFGGPALTSSSLSYDAALAAMFAMVTIPEGDPITGSAIAAGMASLNDPMGTPISFGDPVNTFVQAARNALATGGTVDLQGVSGALNWDPTNGEIRADVLGWELVGDPAQLNPYCIYLLGTMPETDDGIWLSSATFTPPCDL